MMCTYMYGHECFPSEKVIGIYLRSHCETHEDWCLWYQGFSDSFLNPQSGWRDLSTSPCSEVDELALWVVKWQGYSWQTEPPFCFFAVSSSKPMNQEWGSSISEEKGSLLFFFFFFFWSPRINISCGTCDMVIVLVGPQSIEGVDGWQWPTDWTDLPQSSQRHALREPMNLSIIFG